MESSAFGAGDTASLYLEVPVVLEFCCHPRNKQSQTFAAPPGSLGHFAALEIYILWRPARALDGAGCRGWGWGGGGGGPCRRASAEGALGCGGTWVCVCARAHLCVCAHMSSHTYTGEHAHV